MAELDRLRHHHCHRRRFRYKQETREQGQGNKITVSAGYSNPVIVEVPAGLTVESPSNTELKISGIDNQKVSEFAADIRKIRKPEPYKGKGIKYKGEVIRRKEGKKAAK